MMVTRNQNTILLHSWISTRTTCYHHHHLPYLTRTQSKAKEKKSLVMSLRKLISFKITVYLNRKTCFSRTNIAQRKTHSSVGVQNNLSTRKHPLTECVSMASCFQAHTATIQYIWSSIPIWYFVVELYFSFFFYIYIYLLHGIIYCLILCNVKVLAQHNKTNSFILFVPKTRSFLTNTAIGPSTTDIYIFIIQSNGQLYFRAINTSICQ